MVRWRSDKRPPVGAAMTPFPYCVEESAPPEVVLRLMAEHSLRHVPVLGEFLRDRFPDAGGNAAA